MNLSLGERKVVYSINGGELFLNRPVKVPTKLKHSKRYDPKKNFQIGVSKEGQREFLPNHLRILIDLQLKLKEDPKNAQLLFDAIEKIYDGEDPIRYKGQLEKLGLKEGFEDTFTDLCLVQLFFLEQDINHDFGKVDPPKAYLMGYIRMIRQNVEEIDKLLWSSLRHPPRKEFLEPKSQ